MYYFTKLLTPWFELNTTTIKFGKEKRLKLGVGRFPITEKKLYYRQGYQSLIKVGLQLAQSVARNLQIIGSI